MMQFLLGLADTAPMKPGETDVLLETVSQDTGLDFSEMVIEVGSDDFDFRLIAQDEGALPGHAPKTVPLVLGEQMTVEVKNADPEAKAPSTPVVAQPEMPATEVPTSFAHVKQEPLERTVPPNSVEPIRPSRPATDWESPRTAPESEGSSKSMSLTAHASEIEATLPSRPAHPDAAEEEFSNIPAVAKPAAMGETAKTPQLHAQSPRDGSASKQEQTALPPVPSEKIMPSEKSPFIANSAETPEAPVDRRPVPRAEVLPVFQRDGSMNTPPVTIAKDAIREVGMPRQTTPAKASTHSLKSTEASPVVVTVQRQSVKTPVDGPTRTKPGEDGMDALPKRESAELMRAPQPNLPSQTTLTFDKEPTFDDRRVSTQEPQTKLPDVKATAALPPPPPLPLVAAKPMPIPATDKLEGFADTRIELTAMRTTAETISATALRDLAPPPPAPPATPAQVTAQISEAIQRTDGDKLEVRLSPEELGRVRMTFGQSEAGTHVHLSAERSETLDLLRRNVAMLEADLRQNGYSGLSFSFAGGGDHHASAEHFDDETFDSFPIEDEPRPHALLQGRVDIRL